MLLGSAQRSKMDSGHAGRSPSSPATSRMTASAHALRLVYTEHACAHGFNGPDSRHTDAFAVALRMMMYLPIHLEQEHNLPGLRLVAQAETAKRTGVS